MPSGERESEEEDVPARMKSAERDQEECGQVTCLHLAAAPAAVPAPAPAADDQLAVFAMRRGGGGAWCRRLMPRTISCFFGARCRNTRCRFSHGDENSFVDVNTRWRRDSGASGSGGGGAWSGKAGGSGARPSATLACYFGAHCRQPRCRSVSFSPPTHPPPSEIASLPAFGPLGTAPAAESRR
jgi:hypothetical protein